MNDRFVMKRYLNIALILFWTLAGTTVISLLHGKYMDEVAVYLIIDLIFMALLLFVLEHNRMHKNISSNKETTFRRILHGYLISWMIARVSSFLPEFLKPMLAIPLVMMAFGTHSITICVGMFLNAMLCLILGSTIYEMVLYTLLILLGCMLADAIEEGRLRFWYELAILTISTTLPALFYYLAYRETKLSLLLFGALEGLVIDVFLHLFYMRAVEEREAEIPDMLDDMLDDAYPLGRELKNFSKADYKHAKRVSHLSGKCARVVGADEKLCAAAGFYYRIGILEGDSIVSGGVRIAQRECFPEDIIRIISEYNGEQELPSNIESAIVHMVDGLIKKLEVLDADMMSSGWNQNMVIYQTLNDFSARGLYDKSGLSMNMFLKIREYLVNEEALL